MSRIEVDDKNAIVLKDDVVDNDENDEILVVEPVVKIEEGKTNIYDLSLVSTYLVSSLLSTQNRLKNFLSKVFKIHHNFFIIFDFHAIAPTLFFLLKTCLGVGLCVHYKASNRVLNSIFEYSIIRIIRTKIIRIRK